MTAERGQLAVKPWQVDTGVNARGCRQQAANRADGKHTRSLEQRPKATKSLEEARVQLLHIESIERARAPKRGIQNLAHCHLIIIVQQAWDPMHAMSGEQIEVASAVRASESRRIEAQPHNTDAFPFPRLLSCSSTPVLPHTQVGGRLCCWGAVYCRLCGICARVPVCL